MTSAVTTKSGKGLSYGVVSELATYWEVLPGHEDELRAATQRFAAVLTQCLWRRTSTPACGTSAM